MINLEKDLVLRGEQFVVSSRSISEKFEKEHNKVMLKIKELCGDIAINGDIPERYFIDSKYTIEHTGQEYKEFLLTEIGFSLLVMGFTGEKALKFKLSYVNAFDKMKKALMDIKYKKGDKKHQLECMALLQDMLPDEMKEDKVNFIVANNVINKITSDYFGLPKTIKKPEMNIEMLKTREKILEDYIKLYDVFQDNHMVSNALKEKYKQLMISYGDINATQL